MIQSVDTRGAEPRTFALDPSARILAAANRTAVFAGSGANAKMIPASVAEVLAALNHPNIAQIHGLEKSDSTIALVMELVEGPTLADRIAQGAIPRR